MKIPWLIHSPLDPLGGFEKKNNNINPLIHPLIEGIFLTPGQTYEKKLQNREEKCEEKKNNNNNDNRANWRGKEGEEWYLRQMLQLFLHEVRM